MSRISIVMPTRNEARLIRRSLAQLQYWRERGHEVIVVDGGSTDATAALARPLCDRLIESKPGRSIQMNAGAAAADGDLLLFLHADTYLPADAEAQLRIRAVTRDEAWGRFDVAIDGRGAAYRVIETMMNMRSRLTGIATGDQAIFVSRQLFLSVGGFPPLALMEDIALSSRLRRLRRPICLRSRVITSARRWQDNGIATTVLAMWCLRFAYFVGVSPARLGVIYERGGSARR